MRLKLSARLKADRRSKVSGPSAPYARRAVPILAPAPTTVAFRPEPALVRPDHFGAVGTMLEVGRHGRFGHQPVIDQNS